MLLAAADVSDTLLVVVLVLVGVAALAFILRR
jgi:hypothetical protein